ncbi:hypothetical protein HZH68_015127 [Vespula germanica]|uniref:Uncharacterized protein n=1 Tax=Vespula germanica TaxID=30212 RepID=A0A834J7E4_VESGE|nr:hypothetical protein HZH68_015127 [Vespula germanica]
MLVVMVVVIVVNDVCGCGPGIRQTNLRTKKQEDQELTCPLGLREIFAGITFQYVFDDRIVVETGTTPAAATATATAATATAASAEHGCSAGRHREAFDSHAKRLKSFSRRTRQNAKKEKRKSSSSSSSNSNNRSVVVLVVMVVVVREYRTRNSRANQLYW